jgi:MFS family permease
MSRFLADTRPLQNAHFRRLWTANIITVIGAQLTVVAVPAQIYAITGSSAYVGLTGLFGLVPLIVFGLWGGALADHFDRRTILVITTLGLIATSAGFWAQAAISTRLVPARALRGAAGVLRGQPADAQCRAPAAPPASAAAGSQLAQHDPAHGRRHRRAADRRAR